jgi:hypothetical protein
MTTDVLHGDLRVFFPAEILQLLNLAQADGRLELVRADERVDVFVERGRPVFARTTGPIVRAGEVLVHRRVIAQEVLDRMLALQAERPGRRIGELLVEAGAVAHSDVEAAVREIIKRILYGVLLWREGVFRFIPGETAGSEDTRLELELDRLILDGLRLADEARRT